MKNITRHSIPLIVVLCFVSIELVFATDFILPKDQFGKFPKRLPQNLQYVKEQLINVDARYEPALNYSQSDSIGQAALAVGHLDIKYSSGNSMCTASILSEEYLITNAHCVPGDNQAGRVEAVQFRPNYYDDGPTWWNVVFDVDPTPVEFNHDYDFAILKVHGNPARKYGTIKIAARDPGPSQSLVLIHHPMGGTKQITRYGCRAQSPQPISNENILHLCDSLPGSSGSPLLLDGSSEMVGLHFAGALDKKVNMAKRVASLRQVSRIVDNLLKLESPVVQPLLTPPPEPIANPPTRTYPSGTPRFVKIDRTIADTHNNLMWTEYDYFAISLMEAENACQESMLGGHKDWRLPKFGELETLFDPKSTRTTGPVQRELYMVVGSPEPQHWYHWSATKSASGESVVIDFKSNSDFRLVKTPAPDSDLYGVFCVRDIQPNQIIDAIPSRTVLPVPVKPTRFQDSGGGTVTDTKTGFVWTKNSYRAYSYKEAKNTCENLTIDSRIDWRLPTADEVVSLIERAAEKKRIDLGECYYRTRIPEGGPQPCKHAVWTSIKPDRKTTIHVTLDDGKKLKKYDEDMEKGYVHEHSVICIDDSR